jgi:hypothetical protein
MNDYYALDEDQGKASNKEGYRRLDNCRDEENKLACLHLLDTHSNMTEASVCYTETSGKLEFNYLSS